jgi:two-component system, response regulator RegA
MTSQQLIIIDDDATYLQLLQRRLQQVSDFKVHTFQSTAQALAAPRLVVHAILLDMMLEHETGLDGIVPLRQHYSPRHLIMLTGYASIATTVEAMRRGATDYLTKPIGLQELLARLNDDAPNHRVNALKPMTPAQVEWEHIQRVLQANNGNISITASTLGMHRRSLQRKLQKYSPSKN